MDEVIAGLETARARKRAFRDRIAAGETFAEAFSDESVRESLEALNRGLKHLEESRHRTRTTAFALGLVDGESIGGMARLYGFSRQLAQRFAHEAHEPARNVGIEDAS